MINYVDVLEKAINTYGTDNQLNICMEEMSELIKEISKHRRGFENKTAVTEEIADVYIMLEQLKMMLNISEDDVNEWFWNKIDRLEKRMEEEDD